MTYTVLYHINAKSDITTAKLWYKDKSHGLEKRFLKSVQKTIKQISSNPYSFETRYRDTHIAFTPTFPYGIHYQVNDSTKTIIILAVLHTSLASQY
ncbi:type II toxin-antitoxin system RelE/ParE family toxin [Myroides sp. N17-2]|uniref:type II toxin-antitoxin system RelE/ParE family toxin n=1 Tax=Myroides sp. N17-2 TaxID=2030799 RepID=UPI000EFBAB88|nr:type II toxin-antitoxin system RelE/ParE family toxin [Myroides sp. N17-2]